MKYEIACNWDPALIDGVAGSLADELFGGMPNSPVSGGRASFVAVETTPEFVEKYVKRRTKRG